MYDLGESAKEYRNGKGRTKVRVLICKEDQKVDEMRRRDMIHLHRLACLAFLERNWEIKLLHLYIYGTWERCILAYRFA